eukprot:CAMPEP_0172306924 /NCGR_PEP_ID=MMETSP1058-20130122/7887_1 /TAXON_ID=83371 /ORGANISM="Detonula confervacea, Strain CCMP 353" /LENGTH=276 /DNA_ID=CAMNT_0013018965 /DNA_START=364 /DNA_END=1194 /DNA_ORIENTATION=+
MAMETPSGYTSVEVEQDIDSSLGPKRNRRSSRRRRQFICPSRCILLALCCSIYQAAKDSQWRSHAFSSPVVHASHRISSFSNSLSNENTRNTEQKTRPRGFYMSAVAEPPAQSNSSAPRMTDFQRRMKGLIKRGGAATGRRAVGQRATGKPTNLRTVQTLEEYKEVLDENRGKIVVARFFATWCKACKAIQPAYYRMASLYPHVIFLEVPVTNQNANLHQGLEVPSLPYGHIYSPEAGLVEELKISRKHFHNLVKMVRWYDEGECKLDDHVVPPEE